MLCIYSKKVDPQICLVYADFGASIVGAAVVALQGIALCISKVTSLLPMVLQISLT
jgi:hypothetical protein